MKNAKTFLQQGPLMVAGIEKFDLCKEDILRSVMLTEQEHWTIILDLSVPTRTTMYTRQYQPTSHEAMAALNPEELLW